MPTAGCEHNTEGQATQSITNRPKHRRTRQTDSCRTCFQRFCYDKHRAVTRGLAMCSVKRRVSKRLSKTI